MQVSILDKARAGEGGCTTTAVDASSSFLPFAGTTCGKIHGDIYYDDDDAFIVCALKQATRDVMDQGDMQLVSSIFGYEM